MALVCSCGSGGLTKKKFPGASVAWCEDCEGTLVAQKKLIPFMEDLARDLLPLMKIDERIDPALAPTEHLMCPACRNPMERFGYMGTHLVRPSRCRDCGVVWIGGAELPVMTVLFARTKLRRQKREELAEAESDAQNRRVHLMLRARFKSDAVAGIAKGGAGVVG